MKDISVPLCFFIWNLSFLLTLNVKSIKVGRALEEIMEDVRYSQPPSNTAALKLLPFVSLEFTEPLVFNTRQTVA